jgi:hypothetical protein
MLQANQPYNRVDNGMGAGGMVAGGLIGGAAMGGLAWGSSAYSNHIAEQMSKAGSASKAYNIGNGTMSRMANSIQHEMFGGKAMKETKNVIPFMRGGLSKRSAFSLGAGIVGGALLGGLMD